MKIIALLALGATLALAGCREGGTTDEYNTERGTGSGSTTTNTAPRNNNGTGNATNNPSSNTQP